MAKKKSDIDNRPELFLKNGYNAILANIDDIVETAKMTSIPIILLLDRKLIISETQTLGNPLSIDGVTPDFKKSLNAVIGFVRAFIETMKEYNIKIGSVVVEDFIGSPLHSIVQPDLYDVEIFHDEYGITEIDSFLDLIAEELPKKSTDILKQAFNDPSAELLIENNPEVLPGAVAQGVGVIINDMLENSPDKAKDVLKKRLELYRHFHQQISELRKDNLKLYLLIYRFRDISLPEDSEFLLAWHGLTKEIIRENYDALIIDERVDIGDIPVIKLSKDYRNIIADFSKPNVVGFMVSEKMKKEVLRKWVSRRES